MAFPARAACVLMQLALYSAFYSHFSIQRHLISRTTMKMIRVDTLSGWRVAATA